MKKIFLCVALQTGLFMSVMSQTTSEEKEVLGLVNNFFILMDKQDSVSFQKLHLEGARYYMVYKQRDSIKTNMRDVTDFHFNPKYIIKERMRDKGVKVEIQDRVAMVWAPYDLWENNTFSHCGIDVFTLLKTPAGWKIASLSFSMEKDECK